MIDDLPGYQNYDQVIGQGGGGGITITDLITGVDQGTQLVTLGVAIVPTVIDFTGVAIQNDLVLCSFWARNFAARQTVEVYSDVGGNFKLIPEVDRLANGTVGDVAEKTGLFVVRVGADPAASAWYAWSGAPSDGLDVFAVMVISGASITWLP